LRIVTARSRQEPPLHRQGELARARAGIEASERDEVVELTEEEAESYCETGVLPERVTKWAASRG
jgi:hypothetical protein